jgi:hypothetical protein
MVVTWLKNSIAVFSKRSCKKKTVTLDEVNKRDAMEASLFHLVDKE